MPEEDSRAKASAAASRSAPGRLIRTLAGYGFMVSAAVVILFLICKQGETLQTISEVAEHTGSMTDVPNVLLRVLVALSAVIGVGHVLAKCFAYLGQPPVIGEVVAGILLGPSLLGPETSALILPSVIAPVLGVIAQLGVILYMFAVGLSLQGDRLKNHAHAAVAISHAGIVAPFLLGAILALYLYSQVCSRAVPFTSFALFMGVAMSITAFPVLARILADLNLNHTELGILAIGCAAAGDATAWCLLAFVVAVAKSRPGEGLLVAGATLAYIGIMLLAVRPLLRRVIARWESEHPPRQAAAFVFLLLLLSALATEAIGIHAIFGAFLLGVVIPAGSGVARSLSGQLESLVNVLLLPAFFAFTGMRTRIDLLSNFDHWFICGVIILVATAGKFGGTLFAARLMALDWRRAVALGTLMNTRGLMELIVLNIGLDLQVISPTLFAMMVFMALATTIITAPVLRWVLPEPQP